MADRLNSDLQVKEMMASNLDWGNKPPYLIITPFSKYDYVAVSPGVAMGKFTNFSKNWPYNFPRREEEYPDRRLLDIYGRLFRAVRMVNG